ncbi:MAG: PmoA family protein [Planctomycetota bacterium]
MNTAALGIKALILLTLLMIPQSASGADEFRIEKADSGWNIFRGDQLVAVHLTDAGGKPIIYPLKTLQGVSVTRDFPMKAAGKFERDDHDHHRSLWLTHGEVNGIDFWLDDADRNCGRIVQTDATADVIDGAAVLNTKNDWISADGKPVLSDTRRFTFRELDGRHVVDCDYVLHASAGDVNFGDTKEGTFGIRVAGSMKVDAKLGGKVVSDSGKVNKGAWGQPANWVDYTGPVGESRVGVTIHYHTQSHNAPCRWHVRTYGLFAANPFGTHHFTGGERTEGYTLKSGQSLPISVRVVLHDGELNAQQAAKDNAAYNAQPLPKL